MDRAELRHLNQSTYAGLTDRKFDVKSAQHIDEFSDEETLFGFEDNQDWTKFINEQGDWWPRLHMAKSATTANRYKPYLQKFVKEFPLKNKKLFNQ